MLQTIMNRPDYSGTGIVNLMASVIRARGGEAAYPDLAALPAADLRPARHLILLVIDGLGDDWLQRRHPHGLLARGRIARLTSVFPTTTASAIPSFLTGTAPQQHGLTGWFMWLQELGCVMTVLPGRPRYGGVGYRAAGVDLTALYGQPPVFDRIDTSGLCVSPEEIARSDFNLAHLGAATLLPFAGLPGLVQALRRAVRLAQAPSYIYAYWPGLDSIGHAKGIESSAASAHLLALETQLAWLIDRLRGSDSLLLVTADHGQLDHGPADLTRLETHPDLVACLRMPLCGEPRAAYCYVRPGQDERFERYCSQVLGERFTLHRSEELLAMGLFGSGTGHPRLAERIGDYVLIGRDRQVIHDALTGEPAFRQIGVHGGLSSAELHVPLCRFDC